MRALLTLLLLTAALPLMAQSGPPTPAAFREIIAGSVKALHIDPQLVAMVKDTTIQQVGTRIYRPALTGSFPVVFFIHGAAWIAGNLETHDNICRYLTNALQAVVVAFDYHRPPEHKFPTSFYC